MVNTCVVVIPDPVAASPNDHSKPVAPALDEASKATDSPTTGLEGANVNTAAGAGVSVTGTEPGGGGALADDVVAVVVVVPAVVVVVVVTAAVNVTAAVCPTSMPSVMSWAK